LPESATNTPPAPSSASAEGALKAAESAGPSA